MNTTVVMKLVGVCVLAGWLPGRAQTSIQGSTRGGAGVAERPGTPSIQFAETTYDFGRVMSGEVIRHSFLFTNVGTGPLEIRQVTPGCGCTTADTWDRLVEAGKTGSIPLQLNSAGFGGNISKTTTVFCNDPRQTSVVLHITGTVWKPIEVSPTLTVFSLWSDGQTNETKVVRIVNNLETPLTLSDLQCTNQAFHTELATVREGKEFELRISTVTPIESSSVNSTVTVKTSSTNLPVIRVTAYAVVQPAVTVSPTFVALPAGPLPTLESRLIIIRNNSNHRLAIPSAAVSAPGAEVTVEEMQPGKVYGLKVSFPVGFQLPPGKNAEITATSNHPKYPQLKMLVLQATAAQAPAPRPAPPAAIPAPVPPSQLFPYLPAQPTAVDR